MEVVLEQFIPSDRAKKISNILKNMSIIFLIISLMTVLVELRIGIVLAIAALLFFLGSYFAYIDYEYELYNGDITITKVYNASRRKIAEKFSKDQVKRVYVINSKNDLNKDVKIYYNTNINGLKIYTFQLENNKAIRLALNEELEKIVKIIYAQKINF